jgi:hypothetical protein
MSVIVTAMKSAAGITIVSALEAVCGTHFRAELDLLRQHLDAFNFDEVGKVVERLETLLRES